MRYVSVCSGIEAASVAWHPLGWECAAVSEIEAFPSAVLAHHYPDVPNLGDLTRYADWPDLGPVDLLVGGTPCQSFSVAGLRQGLADPRGNLALVFLGLLDRLRPRWVVWENVPGVLSSSGGRDFGSFLGGLAELGYGWAYRVLDAQYFGVAQRRRRVFVVGYLGDWRPPVAVLFEPESLRGDTPPRREAGERVAPTLASRLGGGGGLGTDCDLDGGVMAFDTQQITPAVANPLTARMHKGINTTCDEGQTMVAHAIRTAQTSANGHGVAEEVAHTLDQAQGQAIVHSLRGTGHDAGEDGTGRGTPLVAHAIQERAVSENLENGPGGKGFQPDLAYTLEARNKVQSVQSAMQVRRLTPVECARLQGFQDDYLDILYRGKPAADGPKYKALGNSMAVPCMSWLGERIAMVDALDEEEP